jgi:micrococcal nuclease
VRHVLLSLALLTAAACSPAPPPASPAAPPAAPVPAASVSRPVPAAAQALTITRVVDGDTFEATGAGGGTVAVRVLGIDTPETRDPRKPVQCWGPEASRWAGEQLRGRRVVLFTDPAQDVRDRYGRLLAYVDRDGWDYSVEAARAGMARAYTYAKPVARAGLIAAAEQQARAARRGLWGPPCEGKL